MADPALQDSPRRFVGHYRLDGVLGRGAMGVVYRTFYSSTGQPIALKTINHDLLAGSERDAVISRFLREAEIGMRLSHRRIVKVHDRGEVDGVAYLTMDLVDGRELKSLIGGRHRPTVAAALALVAVTSWQPICLPSVPECGACRRTVAILECNRGANPAEISAVAPTAASADGGNPPFLSIPVSLTS